MRVDSNTNGHRQWFFFSMKNEKKCRLKINVYRFKKPYSLFQRGMRPYVKSRKSGKEWKPGGDSVCYRCERQRNQYGVSKEVKSYVLSFYYSFEHQNDEVFIAAGIPYSYTYLQKQLSYYKGQVSKDERISFEITTMCKSMCGMDLPLLTIESKRKPNTNRKKFIIINARTHSGETSSSWVLDGFLQQLTQSAELENWLSSENICLKVVPMLNPDGVFIGNYRTGIIGQDFNRRFTSGRKQFYPELHYLKKIVNQCKRQGQVQLFLDLHGHSILKNSFIYGPSQNDSAKFRMNCLPYYLLHNSKYFRLASCRFKTDKDSVETARGYFQMKQEILSFTCQNSLGLYYNQSQTFQMLSSDWQAFGQAILGSLIDAFRNKSSNIQNFSNHQALKLNKCTYPEKKNQDNTRIYPQVPKTSKNERVNNKKASIIKNIFEEKLSLTENAVSFSEQIHRQDETVEMKSLFYTQKNIKQQTPKEQIRLRGKSEVMKIPNNGKMFQSIINKDKLKELERKYSRQQTQNPFGRSLTYDTSYELRRQIEAANKLESEQGAYQMDIINQNFSDEYVSINDSDSQGDNLPEQQKKYLFQYIKSNQHKLNFEQDDERLISEKEEKESKQKMSKEARISGFRQIRFKSIEQLYASDTNVRQATRNNSKKLKIDPHKFKDSHSKTLIYKYQEVSPQSEFDDPAIVTFSQQKKLNERNQQRRTQKDPFVLFQRKQKSGKIAQKD